MISSRENRWLKEFRVALRGGLATEKGYVGVEGVRLVGRGAGERVSRGGGAVQRMWREASRQIGAADWATGDGVPCFENDGSIVRGNCGHGTSAGSGGAGGAAQSGGRGFAGDADRSVFAAAGGAGRSTGPGKCGNDSEDGGGVWRDGSGNVGDSARRDGESVFAEGAAGFGGSGAASAGAGGNVADDSCWRNCG